MNEVDALAKTADIAVPTIVRLITGRYISENRSSHQLSGKNFAFSAFFE